MVVAHDGEHAAVRGRTRRVGMLQHVHRAIEARTLAVPDAENAVILRTGAQAHLLAAPHGGGGQILVHARAEHDVPLFQQLPGMPEFLVIVAQRRSAIAGNETSRIEACRPVAGGLYHRQTHQRLQSRHKYSATLLGIFVFERNARIQESHVPLLPQILSAILTYFEINGKGVISHCTIAVATVTKNIEGNWPLGS